MRLRRAHIFQNIFRALTLTPDACAPGPRTSARLTKTPARDARLGTLALACGALDPRPSIAGVSLQCRRADAPGPGSRLATGSSMERT